MAELVWTLEVYARLVGVRLRAQMRERVTFLLLTLGTFAQSGVDFLALVILLLRVPQLAGWTLGELAFLYGTCALSFGLMEMVLAGFDLLPFAIQRGEFDQVMLRPVGAFLQTLAADFQLRRLGRMGQGLVSLLLAMQLTPITWTAAKLLYLPVMVLSGSVIFGAIFVIGAAACFWTVKTVEVTNIFTYGGVQLTSYPLEIYAGWLRRVVMYLVPLAFVNYFPALWMLDRSDPFGLPPVFPFLSPVAALLTFLAARAAWAAGIRHYQSTGS